VRKRVLRWAVLFAALAGLGLAALWWAAPAPGSSWRSDHRIELGMTEQEVAAILTLPPGSHLDLAEDERLVYDHAAAASKGVRDAAKGYSWVGNEGNLGVSFDAADRVVGVSFTPLRRENPSLLDRFRRWLGL
jgi:hypothetical protein